MTYLQLDPELTRAISDLVDQGEIMTRETTDPFPGCNFAKPPH